MEQNATLDAKRVLALAALLEGQNMTDAAQAADVDRSTLYRWLDEPAFAAELNKGKRELQDALHSRLLSLGERAVGVVQEALDGGDAKTALAVLKGLGLLDGGVPIGPTDARDLEIERTKRKSDQTFAALMANV